MNDIRSDAADSFRKTMILIVVLGVLTVAGALWYLHAMGAWNLHAIIATVLGVFLSMVLGCGLFALAFFSDKSGHDENVTRSTADRANGR